MGFCCTRLEEQYEVYNGFTGEDCLWRSKSLFFLWHSVYTIYLFFCDHWQILFYLRLCQMRENLPLTVEIILHASQVVLLYLSPP